MTAMTEASTKDQKFVKITVRNPDSRMELATLVARAALQAQKKLAADGYPDAIEVGVERATVKGLDCLVVLVQAKRAVNQDDPRLAPWKEEDGPPCAHPPCGRKGMAGRYHHYAGKPCPGGEAS